MRPPTSAPSPELVPFLTDLAVAVHTYGVYPAGHPLRTRAAESFGARTRALLEGRPSVSLGVARRRLVVEGVATAEEHALLAGLADRLHRMRVGAVTLHAGIEAGEVERLLLALAAEPERGQPVRPESWPAGEHLRMHPMRFGGLRMADADPDAPGDAEAAGRAAQLWMGLAQAAMARGDAGEAAGPDEVARAIEEHPGAEAYDQVVVGYLLQLAEELGEEGAAGEAVRVRASRVVADLSPATLRRLLRMGGDAAQRRRFVLNASRAFASPAVVRVVEAAAGASGETVSHSLLRLLRKLASYGGADPAAAPHADAELEAQVRGLVDGWSLADPNPDGYTQVLRGFSTAAPRAPLAGAWPSEPDRVLQTALEADADGVHARAAAAHMLEVGRGAELVAMLAAAPAGSSFAEVAWGAAASPDGLRALLADRRPDAEALDAVVSRLGAGAVPVLAEALADSPSRLVRRMAFDRLAALGGPAREAAAAMLGDARWFVVRNALALLAEAGTPEGLPLAPHLRHGDPRVRREAYRLAFRTPGERARGLALALADGDALAVREGLTEALAGCPPEAVPLVCRHARTDAPDAELRVLALRVLGAAHDAIALRTLLDAADGGRGWLGRRRIPPRSTALLAALGSLAAGWSEHPAAAELLSRARAAGDPLVRAAAGGAP